MNESKHTEVNKVKWDRWAKSADGKGLIYDYLRGAQLDLISLLNLKENIFFLDIGCGTGWAVGKVAERTNYRGSYYGVDLSVKMIERAKEKFRDPEHFTLISASSESIPIESDLFDIIICTNSFHHYLHPGKAMSEIYRLLKSGGRIYILDPLADSWIIKIADRIIKILEPAHVKIYSTAEFKTMMSDAGLKYIGSEKINPREKVQIGEK